MQVRLLVQMNLAALWLMKTCTFLMARPEITTEGAQSLRIMKLKCQMPNAKLYLKEATVIYGFHPLGARLPEKKL